MHTLYLDEFVEELFAAHVTVDSVVSVLEVRSEVVKKRVQVQQVVAALFTAVDALTTLTQTDRHTDKIITKEESLHVSSWFVFLLFVITT